MIRAIIVSALLVVAITTTVSAQTRGAPTGPTGGTRRDAAAARENDVINSDLNFRRLANDAKARPSSPRDRKLTIDQIVEDFKTIQLNSKDLRLSITSETINYRQVAKLAEEINKRAKRLKENLAIPDFESDMKDFINAEGGSQQIKASLPVLGDLIKSFVTNPLFYNLKVTRVGDVERAKQDIAGVIQLSLEIKKAAVKLK